MFKKRIFKRYKTKKRGGQHYRVGRRKSYILPSQKFIDPLGLTKTERKKYDERLDKLEAEGNDIGPLLEYEMDMAPGPKLPVRKKMNYHHWHPYRKP